MKFLLIEDFDAQIQEQHLEQIVKDGTLDACEAAAVSEVSGYLRNRFDLDKVFPPNNGSAEYKSSRDALLVQHIVCLTLYRALMSAGWSELAQIRQACYDEAINWLKEVKLGNIDPGYPAPIEEDTGEEEDTTLYKSKGAPKRDNRI